MTKTKRASKHLLCEGGRHTIWRANKNRSCCCSDCQTRSGSESEHSKTAKSHISLKCMSHPPSPGVAHAVFLGGGAHTPCATQPCVLSTAGCCAVVRHTAAGGGIQHESETHPDSTCPAGLAHCAGTESSTSCGVAPLASCGPALLHNYKIACCHSRLTQPPRQFKAPPPGVTHTYLLISSVGSDGRCTPARHASVFCVDN